MIWWESLSCSAPILEETGMVKGRRPLLLIDTGGGSGYKGGKDTHDGNLPPRPLPYRHQLLFLPGLSRPAAPYEHPGSAHQRRLWGDHHAPQGAPGAAAPAPGPGVRRQRPHLPAQTLRRLQGAPAAHARGPGDPAPLYKEDYRRPQPAL